MATPKEIEYLLENFDYKGLKNLGFYNKSVKSKDYDAQIERICKWFGIKSIFQYDTIGLETRKFIKSDLKTFSKN